MLGKLVDIDFDLPKFLSGVQKWVKKYALTPGAISELAQVLDDAIKFKRALKPLEIADKNLFESVLKGMIKPEDLEEEDD